MAPWPARTPLVGCWLAAPGGFEAHGP
jgi:hypothetical protein